MILLGASSDITQSFIAKVIEKEGKKYPKIYLVTSNKDATDRLANHLHVKYNQASEVIVFDVTKDSDYSVFDAVHSDLLFCAIGFLGESVREGLYDAANVENIVAINYARLVPLINYFAQKFEQEKTGTIIALSSVAGLRGRQSNFIYGSAKAGFRVYLDGLRNYLYPKGVHVITVIPGFMDTKMTEGLSLPKLLTTSPQRAANVIYNACKHKRNRVYVTGIWRCLMFIIGMIPESIFKKMKM
ncbi:MAG: SDR family NAD(P)-dependent oxidoreductase [Dysgonamonadaceae bacterium]|jgi:short-subunit dehydrogenase|nr:SDR family NAD(P)-dependent oxidoreductase [Dysgonamonadaceae bacterium]